MFRDLGLFPSAASSHAAPLDLLHLSLVVIGLSVSTAIATCIVVFCIRFRRSRRAVADVTPRAATRIELVWSILPLIFFLGFFTWGAKLFVHLRQIPEEGMSVWVTGKQWMWKVQHPTGHREINALHVPLGQNVILTMTSQDVIHSFFVPAFRMKFDVLPGRYTKAWFRPTRLGRYHLFCAEYCGTNHSRMVGEVVVMEAPEYERWLAGTPAGPDPVSAGRALYEELACGSCHDVAEEPRGPRLEGLFGSVVALEGGGRVVADESYLRRSIVEPNASITAGWQPLMPSYAGQVGEEALAQLVAYVKSLGDGESQR